MIPSRRMPLCSHLCLIDIHRCPSSMQRKANDLKEGNKPQRPGIIWILVILPTFPRISLCFTAKVVSTVLPKHTRSKLYQLKSEQNKSDSTFIHALCMLPQSQWVHMCTDCVVSTRPQSHLILTQSLHGSL